MSAPATVSVVITTFNRRVLLSETTAMLTEQSFPDWEAIIVDDASTDDTEDWLQKQTDRRVRIFRNDVNRERSESRNRGLAEARGEFVMFLDDDDLLRPDALATLVAGLRYHPDAVAATGACRILAINGDSTKVYRPAWPLLRSIWKELLFGWWANSGQSLYRTSVVRAVGGFDPQTIPCEDRKFWLQVARRGLVYVIPSVVMEYRLHEGQHKFANVEENRRRVWSEFIATLPAGERSGAKRIRRAAALISDSERARLKGEFGFAVWNQLRAIGTAPYLMFSPLTARPIWWGIKKSLLRQIVS